VTIAGSPQLREREDGTRIHLLPGGSSATATKSEVASQLSFPIPYFPFFPSEGRTQERIGSPRLQVAGNPRPPEHVESIWLLVPTSRSVFREVPHIHVWQGGDNELDLVDVSTFFWILAFDPAAAGSTPLAGDMNTVALVKE
jgi:hypothetical protein